MSNQDWLSLSEIARRWGEETGENAETLERDLQAWFSAFVARAPARSSEAPNGAGDSTNVLMGWLGSRYLQRETLARYCEERDRAMPRFWLAENGDDLPAAAPGTAPGPEPAAAESQAAESQAAESQAAKPLAAKPTANAPAAADVAALDPDPTDPPVPTQPNGPLESWPEPDPPQPAAPRPAPEATASPPATTEWFGRPAVRLAGGIALGLAFLAAGYFIGHGNSGAPPAGPQVAAPDAVPAMPAGELREDLISARRQIDTLGAALEASESEVRQLKKDLKRTHHALDTARQMAEQADRPEAQGSAPSDGASNGTSASDVAALKADLAAARQTIDDLRAAAPGDTQSEAVKRSLIEAAASASSQAMAYKAELRDARDQIAELQRDAQIAKAAADALSAELDEARQRPAAAQADPARAASAQAASAQAEAVRQRAVLAAQIASTQADLSKQELAAVRTRLARAESEAEAAKAEAEAAKAEAARLAGELADQRQSQTVALGTATVASEGARRELMLAAQAASVHAAKLAKDLSAARRQIAELETEGRATRAEAVGLAARLDEARRQDAESLDRLRTEAAARQRELDEARDRIASLQAARRLSDDEGPGPVDQPVDARTESDTVRRAVDGPVLTSTRQVARPSGQPLDLLTAGTDQEVARRVVRRSAPSASSAPAEAIDVDVLVADPGRYDARRVMVTGSLMSLLQHYRLQSQSGVRTLVVDVEGLDRDQYDRLRQAIADAGLIGSVEAQISGTVERGAAESFRLVASDLKLVD